MRRLRPLTLFVALCLTVWATGPVRVQDVQVPVDRDSTVYTIDPALRDALGLFPEVDGFQGAELYRRPEETYELVVRYRANGVTLVSTFFRDCRARMWSRRF